MDRTLGAAALLLAAWVAPGGHAMETVRTVVDFSDAEEVRTWRPLHDQVMGGRSAGGLKASGEGTAIFAGEVSLANGGGFASVRGPARDPALGGCGALVVRVRGDGRRYQLRVHTDDAFDGVAYRAYFEPEADWTEIRLPLADFEAVFRGRRVPDAPPLEAERIRQMGLMISEKQAGPFRLELARVDAVCAGQ